MKSVKITKEEANPAKRIKCHDHEDIYESETSDIPSFFQNYLIEHSNIKTIAIIGHESSRGSL